MCAIVTGAYARCFTAYSPLTLINLCPHQFTVYYAIRYLLLDAAQFMDFKLYPLLLAVAFDPAALVRDLSPGTALIQQLNYRRLHMNVETCRRRLRTAI